MRKTLIIILLLSSLATVAQTLKSNTNVTLNIGTKGYVTINGNNYMRGSLRSYFRTSDSAFGILYLPDRTTFIAPMCDTFFIYGDSSNRKVYNFNYLKNWVDSNFEYRGN